MKISVEFDSMQEFEEFRTSGKKTRSKKEEEAEQPAPVGGQPVMVAPQGFAPPQAAVAIGGFPGANGAAPPPAANPLVGQIITKLDGALASGQSVDMMTKWFRDLLGADAQAATLDQIKQIFIPRLPEPQLKHLAQQVGIPV